MASSLGIGTHGDEFFGRGGMQRNRRVEISLGSLHSYRDGDRLNDLGSGVADNMTADHAIRHAVDHELHQNAGVAAGQRSFQWPEARVKDVNTAKPCARLYLGQSHRANLRLTKHGGRNVCVIDFDRTLAEYAIGEGMAFADRNRRQVETVGDVADGVDIRCGGLRELVDGDAAVVWIDGDPGFFQPEISDAGMPTDREHHLVRSDARSIRQMRGVSIAIPVDPLDRATGHDGDAVLFHLTAHMGANVLVEATQDVVAAVDHCHIGAEAREDAGELQRDVPAALDKDAPRQFSQVERLV